MSAAVVFGLALLWGGLFLLMAAGVLGKGSVVIGS